MQTLFVEIAKLEDYRSMSRSRYNNRKQIFKTFEKNYFLGDIYIDSSFTLELIDDKYKK